MLTDHDHGMAAYYPRYLRVLLQNVSRVLFAWTGPGGRIKTAYLWQLSLTM